MAPQRRGNEPPSQTNLNVGLTAAPGPIEPSIPERVASTSARASLFPDDPAPAPGTVPLASPSSVAQNPVARFGTGWKNELTNVRAKAAPEPAAYIEALLELVTKFSRMSGAHGIRLVHVHATGGRVIQIHPASIKDDRAECRICGEVQKPFSFSICAGEQDAAHLSLVFPAGQYLYSNYPNGYSSLFDGPLGETFTIRGVAGAAELGRTTGGGTNDYSVEKKMLIL